MWLLPFGKFSVEMSAVKWSSHPFSISSTLAVLHKAITAGHKEVVKALHKIGQGCLCSLGSESPATVHPVVIKLIFKPPEAPAQAADPVAVPAKP